MIERYSGIDGIGERATWFHLPQEIKQMIFAYILDTPWITFVIRDRRRKMSYEPYASSLNFRALWFVSKQFADVNDLNAALLKKSTLVFRHHAHFTRFRKDATKLTLRMVRSIKLCGERYWDNVWNRQRDEFERLNVNLFQNCMSGLRTVTVSCTMTRILLLPRTYMPRNYTTDELMDHAFGVKPDQTIDHDPNNFWQSQVALAGAIFLDSKKKPDAHSQMRTEDFMRCAQVWPFVGRLLAYAQASDTEVIFEIPCFLTTGRWGNDRGCLNALMSSKDWLLKVDFNGKHYQMEQPLAAELFERYLNSFAV